MRTVKTLQLSANLANGDAELMDMIAEVRSLLFVALGLPEGQQRIVQFSIEVEHASGGSTKLQYARRDA